MIVNPMSDMPWNIYLDYLGDQGFDELRDVDYGSLITQCESFVFCHGICPYDAQTYSYGMGFKYESDTSVMNVGDGLSLYAPMTSGRIMTRGCGNA